MGREIRRVPPNWEHPKFTHDDAPSTQSVGRFKPMFNEDYESALTKWLADFDRIRANGPSKSDYCETFAEWLSETPPPSAETYRPKFTDEPTWIQVYETVSEGTPVTPPFPTKDDLADYLSTHGDFWDQQRRADGDSIMKCDPWDRAAAMRFIENEWAPSLVVSVGPGGSTIREPRDG